ncbi:hypothetical protein ACWCZ5_33805, partial [Streptomyces sp. NPDC001667]
MVQFFADEAREFVTGLELSVDSASWVINTPFLDGDYSALRAAGFSSLRVVLGAFPDPVSGVQCRATVDVGFSAGGTSAFLRLYDPQQSVLHLSAVFREGISLPGVADLGTLPFVGPDVLAGAELPSEVDSALSGLRLLECGAVFDPALGRFSDVWLRAELVPERGWEIIPGWLVVEGFTPLMLDASRAPEGGWRVSGSVGLRCLLAGGKYTLTGDLALPSQTLSVAVSRPGDTSDLVGDHLADSGLPSSVAVKYLSLVCRVRDRSYTLSLDLAVNWDFAEDVTLTGVVLQLSGSGSAAITDAVLAGVLDVGGVPVVVEGRRTSGVWGVSVAASGVEFGGFSSWFERTFGAALPGVVAGLVLDRFV